MDILDFLVLPDQSLGLGYARQTHGLTSTTTYPGEKVPAGPAWDVVDLTKDADGFSKRYKVKTSKGWPWDISRFNDQVFLDWVTEQDWTTARDYKKHVQNYKDPATGKLLDGVLMFPRAVSPAWNYVQSPTLASQTEFRIFLNCAWDGQHHFLGDVLQVLLGPVVIDHGGTIGAQPTLIHEYFWSGSGGVYKSKEENLYALHFGWTRWSYSKLNATTGQYDVQNLSRRDTLLAQPPPAVVFPCF